MATTARLYQNRNLTPQEFAEFSALARDIEELCAAGMLEAFRDERGVIRYRPAQLKEQAS